MNCLFIGGVADGAVIDVKGQPFHFYIAQFKGEEWQIWDNELMFEEEKVLKVCYVHNRMLDDFVLYIEQGLTVRHATAGLMMAYHEYVKRGNKILDGHTVHAITEGAIARQIAINKAEKNKESEPPVHEARIHEAEVDKRLGLEKYP